MNSKYSKQYSICNEDLEDYEQERKIQDWLDQQKSDEQIDFKYINSKGNVRNTAVKAQVRLDQEIIEDGRGTFADIIAGSDGRDLYGRTEFSASKYLDAYLFYLNFDEEMTKWLIETLKLSHNLKPRLLEISLKDSEW